MRGLVAEFDDAAGFGWIDDDDGDRWFVHCTEVADGSRTLSTGTTVEFVAIPRLGRYEAGSVTVV